MSEIDVIEAILTAEGRNSFIITRDDHAEPVERFTVALVAGVDTQTFKGATVALAVERWRSFKLARYRRAVEMLDAGAA